ncbi:MAG: HlyD family type I secretion periplasmic adaptor subunit [Proteobacteria bacterium]|nr:HlyD family type I secretion periplasmic adaptor subunit [Pseudomonadota bacterium]
MMTALLSNNPLAFAALESGLIAATRKTLAAGYATCALFAFGLLGYAGTTAINGAVIAPGVMVVEGHLRKVQHQDGGIVSALFVRNGQRVKEGEVLLTLEDSQRRAEFAQIMLQLASQELRAVRLEAERDAREHFSPPDSISRRATEPEIAAMIAAEIRLFEARRRARQGEAAQFEERRAQTLKEIAGLEAQRAAAQAQAVISAQELGNLQDLFARGLTPVTRINPLRRTVVQLEGQASELDAQIARARARISEVLLQGAQIDKQALSEITRDLRETQERIADLNERRTSAEARFDRTQLRAPIDGVVHQLTAFTLGGVIAPGEAVMMLVPESEALLAEGRIDPAFIDQIALGQKTVIRLSSLDSRTTPELTGTLSFISADIEADPRGNGAGHFRARVTLDQGEVERLEGLRLIPGLPAEIHIQTRARTILSYFMKPFTDQIARALRER